MWWSFLIGLMVGGGLVMLAAHRRAVRLAQATDGARAQSAAHLESLAAERDRLRADCERMSSTLHDELRALDEVLAVHRSGDAPHANGGLQRGEQARAQLALVSRGSEALEQFVAGVLFRGEEATRSAEEARRVAAEAAEHAARVERAGTLLAELGDEFGTVRDTMAGLARAGGEIGTFVQTIDGIASQTNLLALNAAIEAARAGVHGRGFAVVADEVRKLADDSSRAAEQVSHAVKAILTAIDRVAKVIGSTDAGLAGVREVTVDAQHALSGVVEGLGRTVTFVEQVAASVSGESSALDGLLADMGGIHDHANAALADATRGEEDGAAREELVTRVLAATERVRCATQRIASSAA